MAETYKKLGQGQLANSTGTLYTVPSSTSTLVGHIRLVNNTGASQRVKMTIDDRLRALIVLGSLK